MKVRMMFVAIVAVMIAVGLLAIINMHKNPGGEREMTMNDEKLQPQRWLRLHAMSIRKRRMMG